MSPLAAELVSEGRRLLKVLAVHPNTAMQEGIARVLRDWAPEIPDLDESVRLEVVCSSALEAASGQIACQCPDILLLEAVETDPDELLLPGAVLASCPDIPIVLLTQSASIQSAVAATRQGAFDFLLQPFTPGDLRYTVGRAARHVMLTRRARELEEEKKRVRFDFIRVLGHELKAPLGAVSTNIGLVTGHYLGEQVSAYDELMERCQVRLEQMRKLIIDLLDMTRLESGRKQRELVPTNLVTAIHDAVELMTPQANERGISMAVEAPESFVMLADRGEIDMMLNNLVSNAVKYNRDDGSVTVTLTPGAGAVAIAVRDTGIGMSEAEVAKLFGEFVRIRNKKTANILGSGLGLSILKRLAELYHGRVEVESEPDVGTTFRVHLQMPPEAALEDGVAAADNASPAQAALSVRNHG